MSDSAGYGFYYAVSHVDGARARGRTVISRGQNLHAAEARLRTLTSPAAPPDGWAQDLWDAVFGAYVADRLARRHPASDHWTRHIELDLPVSDTDRWNGQPAAVLTNLLEVSTGDKWHLTFRRALRPTPTAAVEFDRDPDDAFAQQVALYSGGLDSTAYAAQAARSGPETVFVTFSTPRLAAIQDRVFDDIRRLDDAQRLRRIEPIPLNPRPSRGTGRHRLEPSSRSRGLLFITTAVYIAAAYHATEVVVPENGQLAVNPPLSPARLASSSSRSAHPWVLHQMNALVRLLGGGMKLHNPFLELTKGQVCDAGLNRGLTADTLFKTISCGKPPFLHDARRPQHCGLCVACLLRRSGLHAALGYDHTVYEAPHPSAASHQRQMDTAALERWIRSPYRLTDLIADQPIPPQTDLRLLFDVIIRGRVEIDRWLRSLDRDSQLRVAQAAA